MGGVSVRGWRGLADAGKQGDQEQAVLFNSVPFLLFLPVVFALYYLLRRRAQNVLILAASYLFYGWWDWRFLGLLVVSTIVDYVCGSALVRTEARGRRRLLLGVSLATNLGILGTFKYLGFFVDSACEVLHALGWQVDRLSLELVLPVGISFYTFQTMSYTIDIYRREYDGTRSPLAFACYVAFFPQLVAGPIERASRLVPQFEQPRTFDQAAARDACRQMLWGFFKKMVVADNLAPLVNAAYSSPDDYSGGALLLATYFFAFQIYCDFSGYSDIAIGTARLLGFNLRQNFASPYFASSVAEFWRRWHISLSTWFRDYVYIPLGGSRGGARLHARNVLTTFVLSGFWHGASWTFGAWGLLHGLYLIGHKALAGGPLNALPPAVRRVGGVLLTFHLVLVAWVFFRAEERGDAAVILARCAQLDGGLSLQASATQLTALGLLLFFEARRLDAPHGLAIASWPGPARWLVYYLLTAAILVLGHHGDAAFLYFQF